MLRTVFSVCRDDFVRIRLRMVMRP